MISSYMVSHQMLSQKIVRILYTYEQSKINKIEYLGPIIGHYKIMKSPEKISAILNRPRPSNVEEIRRFLALITYYSRFIPNIITISYPLRKMFWKNHRFYLNYLCESTFLKLKNEICSDPIWSLSTLRYQHLLQL